MMRELNVKVGKGYNIFIEKGIMSSCGKYIKEVSNASKVCLVSDTNVYKIYGNIVEKQLKTVGYEVFTYVLKQVRNPKQLQLLSRWLNLWLKTV